MIEGISLDVAFNNLDQFLEFPKNKTKNIESIHYASMYKIEEHLNEFIKTLTLHSVVKAIPLFSHVKDMTKSDIHLVKSLLELHRNNFMAFFTQRRLDKELNKIDCHLTMLEPADVLLDGFEDKLYCINESALEDLSSYHKAKKSKTLHTLLPLTGTIESKFFSKRLKELLSEEGCSKYYRNDIYLHYKKIWHNFKSILYILYEMDIKIDQDSLTAFHHRQISYN